MPVCLVFAHSDSSSLSAHIFNEIKGRFENREKECFLQDLYGDGFDPVMPLDEIKRRMSLDPLVSQYASEIGRSDRIIIIHPDWWSGPPAILKGWVDRVLRPGTAYDEIRDFPGDEAEFVPLLKGKKVYIVVLSHRDVPDAPFESFWGEAVFRWCGAEKVTVHHLAGLSEKSEAVIAEEKSRIIDDIFAER